MKVKMKWGLGIFTVIIIVSALVVFTNGGRLFQGALIAKACAIELMDVASDNYESELLDTDFYSSFESNGYRYSVLYPGSWDVTSFDFDNFISPGGLNGVSIAIPVVVPGLIEEVPKGPPLRITSVKISGYEAVWKQWFIEDQCAEIGEISFPGGPVNWSIGYLTDKEEGRIIKALIYSIRLAKE